MNLILRFAKRIVTFLQQIFGSILWSPPPWFTFLRDRPWLKNLEGAASHRISDIVARLRINWKTIAKRTAIALLAFIIILGSLIWYVVNKPSVMLVTVREPGLTKLEDELKPDPINIYFSGSAAKLDQIGKTVTKGISISPAIEGEWLWVKDSHLIFKPKTDWAVGQGYTIKMERSLFPNHVHLSRYSYTFKSAPFKAEITSMEFYQDPENPKIKKVVATVKFTHPVDAVSFEKKITLRRADQKKGFLGIGAETYPFTVSYNKLKGEAYIHSKPFDVPEKDTTMVLNVDSGCRSERGGSPAVGKLEQQVPIPGKYTFFRIDSAELSLVRNERYEPEQVLVVNTTAGVSELEIQKNLSVYLLPMDLPAIPGQPEKKNYHWNDPAEIGTEVLNLSVPIKLMPMPTDREYPTLHSFKYKSEAGRYLYVKLNKGIQAYGGYLLAKEFDTIARIPDFPRELGIMYSGAILSLSGEKKLSVFSRDVEAIRFEIGRVLPDQINHLVSQTSGDFTSPYFANYQFNQDNISERFFEVRQLKRIEPGKSQYSAFDFSRYLKSGGDTNRGLFFFNVESWDPAANRSTGMSDKRLILVTDLGVLVKDNAEGSHDAFVVSIHSGHPVSGARVEVLGKNGIAVVSAATEDNGHARFPKLTDFDREKSPTVYLVRKGNDLSFLPYERSERKLNFSRFDTGGEMTGGNVERLSAYLFSERGLYRPGDEFHIGIIVKPTDWRQNVAGIPLEAVVSDSRGLEVKKQKISLSDMGFEEIRYQTEETAPTGEYTASVYIVKDNRRANLLGSTSIRIEEFLPDRMKITTRLSQERAEGWVTPQGLKGYVTLKNLYGTPAVNRRVAANAMLNPAFPVFKAYKEYTFFDPFHAEHSFSDTLPDTVTNDKGEAEFSFNLERFDKATYRLTFMAEGYEAEGGRGVSSESSVLVSPLSHLIGFKPDGDLKYINKGSTRSVELIAIDPSLKKIAVSGLKAKIIEERYVSVLTKQANGTYKYQSVRKELPVSTSGLTIPSQGMHFTLPTNQPGDYVLIVKDNENVELNRIAYSIAGYGNLMRSLEKNAELQIKSNKADYAPGEDIELYIRAPYTGAGLITIERDRVYAVKWFRTDSPSSVQRIRIPENLEGNGYVNVSFVRAIDSQEIFMSPLSYGVMPFSVSREKRTVSIDLETPDLARPGEPFSIRYKCSKPGKVVVFAVDEGILQVANYRTPDPLSHFFKKRALEVKTAQILDLILPEAELIKSLSAPGGDEGREAIGKNLNPFKRKREKPVVYWSGIMSVDTSQKEMVYHVPDYFNGTFRVMAVAVAEDAVGASQKKSHIRGHFVLSPNVPTFVAPGDEFEVSVNVANNVEGSGKEAAVNLEFIAKEQIEILDKPVLVLKITEGREGSASFKVRAKNILGSSQLTFTASLGAKKSRATVELSIRPPVPYMTTIESGYFKSGKKDVSVTRSLYPQFRTLEASASPLPLGIAHGLILFLDKFPYVCTEQVVSKAFPAIVLRTKPEFGYTQKNVAETLEEAIRILGARQNAEGAFGFWAANSHVSDFQTVYAMHFLIEAKERGYSVPQDMLTKGLGYLHTLAKSESDTLAETRAQAYAIYILTRNGVVTTNYITTLREHLDAKLAKTWKKDLTGTYLAATYKILKLGSKADGLIGESRIGLVHEADYEYFYDGLIHDAQYLYILAKHFPERFKDVSGDEILSIVKPITSGNYNTISSSYTIMAMDAYAGTVENLKTVEIRIKELLKDGTARQLIVPKGLFPRVAFTDQAKQVRIEGTGDFNTFYQVTQAGFDRVMPDKEIKERLEIQREYRDLDGKVITKTTLGSEIEVHLKIRSIGNGTLHNMAVVDLLPGGFEVVIEKTRSSQSPAPRTYAAPEESEESEGEGEPEERSEGRSEPSWSPSIGTEKSTWDLQFVDIREDRVVLFGSVGSSAQEFVYRIKATNKGKYTVPPAFGESMYDRTVRARSLGGTMVVESK